MIRKNRSFVRQEPSRDAKLIFIYCEGNKREPQYFKYFDGISHQIKLRPIKAEPGGNNSPTGLYERASKELIRTVDNQSPEYDMADIDEVWFVIDTDLWGPKIAEL